MTCFPWSVHFVHRRPTNRWVSSATLRKFAIVKISRLFRIVVRRTRARRRKRPRTFAHYQAHKTHARAVINERVRHFADMHAFLYGRITIRNQRRRWGSCSKRGNLNFNYRLIFLPTHLMDYVVVHELCHLREFNHSPAFWKEVESILPEYRSHKKELQQMSISVKSNQASLLQRLKHVKVSP